MSRLAATLFVAALVTASCTVTDDPKGNSGAGGTSNGPSSGPGGTCGVEGQERSCKIDINAGNCFEGVQTCTDGAWSDCGPGAAQQNVQQPCAANPCNPTCEEHVDAPMSPLTGTNSGSTPTSSGGQIEGLPDSWQDELLQDQAHVGMNCSTSGACNGDFYCSGSGTTCLPWQPNQFDNTAMNPNFTVPVVCGNDIQVCNRGAVAAPAGIEVNVFDSTVPADIGLCTGFMNTLRGSCLTPAALNPGECISVPGCSGFLSGPGDTALIHVNGADQAPPAINPETNCADSWGIYYDGGVCQCANDSIVANYTGATMYIFLDSSGSMSTVAGSATRWQHAKNALTGFYQAPTSDNYNVAWRMYGNSPVSGCASTSCNVNACAAPQVGPDVLSNPAHEAALIAAMPANSPSNGGGTPHSPTIQGILQWATAYKTANPTEAVGGVYVTDGFVNGCSPTSDAGLAAFTTTAYASAAAIPFWVVAIPGASASFCTAVSEPDANCINLISSTNLAADMIAAFNGIASQLSTCNLAIPNLGQINLTTIQVVYTPSSGPPTQTFTNVGDVANCTMGATDEVYFDDPMNPTTILMCPDTCTLIQGDLGAQIDFTADCSTGSGFAASTFNYQYDGDCSGYGSGTGSSWDFLAYDTTVPGDASVVWEVKTAPTQAELAMATFTTVATATNATPDVTMASPVILSSFLSGADLRKRWLEVQITVNPISGGSQSAEVNDWQFQFTCLANE